MQNPMIRMNPAMSGQPIEMAMGPPLFQAWPNVVKQPARIEMIEKEMAKLENPRPGPVELLLVAELGELAFVVVQVHCHGCSHGSGRPGSDRRHSGATR